MYDCITVGSGLVGSVMQILNTGSTLKDVKNTYDTTAGEGMYLV